MILVELRTSSGSIAYVNPEAVAMVMSTNDADQCYVHFVSGESVLVSTPIDEVFDRLQQLNSDN